MMPVDRHPLPGPTDRRLKRGDTGLVEIGGNRRRYTSTLGRQWNLGPVSQRLRDLHAVIREATEACIVEMRAGVPADQAIFLRVYGRTFLLAGMVTLATLALGFPLVLQLHDHSAVDRASSGDTPRYRSGVRRTTTPCSSCAACAPSQ